MKSINQLPERKIYLTYLDSKEFSRPLELFSHIELTPPKQNKFMLYNIMLYVIEAELPDSYWQYFVNLV